MAHLKEAKSPLLLNLDSYRLAINALLPATPYDYLGPLG